MPKSTKEAINQFDWVIASALVSKSVKGVLAGVLNPPLVVILLLGFLFFLLLECVMSFYWLRNSFDFSWVQSLKHCLSQLVGAGSIHLLGWFLWFWALNALSSYFSFWKSCKRLLWTFLITDSRRSKPLVLSDPGIWRSHPIEWNSNLGIYKNLDSFLFLDCSLLFFVLFKCY